MAEVPSVLNIPNQERFKLLKDQFLQKFGHEPSFFCRAPGRVNLIGEHIDYCGYAVFPMALEQDILAAVSLNDTGKLILSNINPAHSYYSSDVKNYTIDKFSIDWQNYFLCGFRGITEVQEISKPKGMTILIEGTVPPGAGLSSSSALVCCAALATMHANGKRMTKLALAQVCARSERYIGTEGGGMDQAISLLAESGSAKLIEFNPLKATNVKLPEGATFYVADSCAEFMKAASSHYNIRVVECRLATQILSKIKNLDWHAYRKLGDLQKALGVSLDAMVELVDKELHCEPYSKEEICQFLGVSEDELNTECLSENTLHEKSFKLHDRAWHVYSEASRVYKFKEIAESHSIDALEKLGQLMNDSHASCKEKYECSCPELDQLISICLKAGALGSRLTGAGWGGCAVSLVPSEKAESFYQQVKKDYYGIESGREEKLKTSLFATQPGGGGAIYQD